MAGVDSLSLSSLSLLSLRAEIAEVGGVSRKTEKMYRTEEARIIFELILESLEFGADNRQKQKYDDAIPCYLTS